MTSPSDDTFAAVDAAIPFGKGYASRWLMEVHLNDVETGVYDTGLSIKYSPTLRTHDAGLLVLGASPSSTRLNTTSQLRIPAFQKEFDYVNVCPGDCTNRLFLNETRHILFSRIHMHTLGSGGEISLVRANGSIVTIQRRDYYDFNNQQGPTIIWRCVATQTRIRMPRVWWTSTSTT